MAYIGNQPASAFASTEKQTITGNGTTGPYALTHEVAAATDIACFVNNVRQEPGVAYTVSGNQMTMTGNVASTDDFYVVYIGRVVGTVNHPANVPLSATTGTFSGSLSATTGTFSGSLSATTGTFSSDIAAVDADLSGSLGVGTTAPTGATSFKSYKNASANVVTVQNQTSDIQIQMNDGVSTGEGVIYKSGNYNLSFWTNGSSRMKIDGSGRVTMPQQPFFQCEHATNNSTSIPVNSFINHTNRVFNVGNHVNTSGTFTAPVAGVYGLFWKMICAGTAANLHISFLFSAGSHGGSNYHYSPTSPVNQWQVLQMGGYYYLPAGCTVRVYNHSTPWTGHGGSWSVFSGYLLG